jgi:uncharacterized protein (TIGR00297 family)
MPPALAAGISLVTALAAWAAGALTPAGAAAAALVGSAILSATGWPGAAVLGAFFLPSTLVGRITAGRTAGSDAQEERRGAAQVLSNGVAAALGALAAGRAPGLGLWLVTASLAAAAGDTWATSLGALSRNEPRLLLGGGRVPRGTSGAVSPAGTLGAGLGAALVALAAATAGRAPELLWCAAIGVAGMLLDSLLGAAVQARFECPACARASERRRHRCGGKTRLVKGWPWLDNDAVNAVTTGCAALAGAALWRLAAA